ncbi:MAG: PAS domain-containing protein [Desulfobacterales bacterium]|nr:MAG: PAS domain-containing protein [Desulfobacterales bacterium]
MQNESSLALENLHRIADVIVATFGNFCEVAIHDFSDLQHSLVYLAGNVTKRKLGAPVTDLALKEWKQEGDSARDIANYRTVAGQGRMLKSATIFLRDTGGNVIGALCINFDMTDFMDAVSLIRDFFTVDNHNREVTGEETFANTVDETIGALIKETIEQIGKQPGTMKIEDRVNFVDILEKKGTFLIKGAISHVAVLLGVSKFTIYNYLQKAKSKEKIGTL